MYDDVVGKIEFEATGRHAESGLASLLLGGILAMMAMVMLAINLLLFVSPFVWAAKDLHLLFQAAVAGTIVIGPIALFSVFVGIHAVVSGFKRRQFSALGLSGLFISTLALLLWAGAIADLFSVVDYLQRR